MTGTTVLLSKLGWNRLPIDFDADGYKRPWFTRQRGVVTLKCIVGRLYSTFYSIVGKNTLGVVLSVPTDATTEIEAAAKTIETNPYECVPHT